MKMMAGQEIHRGGRDRRFKKKILIIFFAGLFLGAAGTLAAGAFCRTITAVQDEITPQIVVEDETEEVKEPAEIAEDDLEEIRRLAEEENQESETAEELTGDPLDILKGCLENGDATSVALRKAIKDEIVVASGGRYYFLPIDESLKKHDYAAENLVMEEDGTVSYHKDGQQVSKKGIDVSRYQGEIDWERVRADGVEFAFIRAGIRGYGTGKLVPEEGFAGNLAAAVNAGVEVGAYFFSQAVTEEEAVEEADLVIDALSGNGLSYPVVYDLEKVKSADGRMNGMSREEMTKVCLAFLNRISEAGYTPMIYGNLETFCLMLDMKQLEAYPKWLAYYNKEEIYFPYEFEIWQYSEKGRVDGINGDVDLNIQMK